MDGRGGAACIHLLVYQSNGIYSSLDCRAYSMQQRNRHIDILFLLYIYLEGEENHIEIRISFTIVTVTVTVITVTITVICSSPIPRILTGMKQVLGKTV